jgi:prepilin peptidase CpaA
MFYDATISQIVLLAAGAVLLTAAGEDFLDFFISNRLVLALIGLYPIYVFTTGGSVDWLGGILVALAVLAVGFFLFAFNWIGGGDVKLMAAVSLWAGPTLIASFPC